MFTFINKLKENKGLMLIIFGLFIILLIFLFDLSRLNENNSSTQTPKIVKKESELKAGNVVQLVRITPEDGLKHRTLDPFQIIIFEFSDPVDASTIEASVQPSIDHNVRVLEDDKSKVVVLPKASGWLPYTEYQIKITRLKSLDGKEFADTASYRYKNTPPELKFSDLPY